MVSPKRAGFYEAKYRRGQELPRSSKLYTLGCVPKDGDLRILDLGCGTGLNSTALCRQGHRVVGVDISREAMVQYCRRGFTGLVMDLEQGLAFTSQSFDLVFCSEVLEHLVSPGDLLREVFRVLRPGGRLVLSVPNSAFWIYRLAALAGRTLSEVQHPMHLRFFSLRGLVGLLRQAGLRVEEIMGRNMYLLLPSPRNPVLRRMLERLGFREEVRFRTGKSFWHLSHCARRGCSFWADTLIMVAVRPSPGNDT
jgi:methionine biosynthesis protein MetW